MGIIFFNTAFQASTALFSPYNARDKLIAETDEIIAQTRRTHMAIESCWTDLAEIAGEEEVQRFRNITFTENDEWAPSE